MQVIQIKDVCKAFDQRQVLNNISLSVEEGEIFGLLGPSGAGKTTLIKMLMVYFRQHQEILLYWGKN